MLPRKDYHVYITRSTYHYAYARQTQVNWKKEKNKRIQKGKERKEKTRKAKKDKTRRESKERKREKEKKTSYLQTLGTDQRRHWAHSCRGYQVHQWPWGENATRRRSQGGLTLTCYGRWKAHKFQDDGQQYRYPAVKLQLRAEFR